MGSRGDTVLGGQGSRSQDVKKEESEILFSALLLCGASATTGKNGQTCRGAIVLRDLSSESWGADFVVSWEIAELLIAVQ